MNKTIFDIADFVIVTALEEERDAVLDKLPNPRRMPLSTEDTRTCFGALLPVTFDDGSEGTYNVIVQCLADMGTTPAATATSDAIRRWKPTCVLLVGIAGGFEKNDVRLGDVLVSTQIVDYSQQKLTDEGRQFRFKGYPVSERLNNFALNFQASEWQQLVTVPRPKKGAPTRWRGPVASGPTVAQQTLLVKELLQHYPKLVGLEMEAAGVVAATSESVEKPEFFMVRGVSDLCDQARESEQVKSWRLYACDVAASYAIALLQHGPLAPRATPRQRRGMPPLPSDDEPDPEWLSQQWFKRRLKAALDDAGPRYTPDLNVDLPIARVFEGIGRTEAFLREVATYRGKLRKTWRDTLPNPQKTKWSAQCLPLFEKVRPVAERLTHLLQPDGLRATSNFDWAEIKTAIQNAETLLADLDEELEALTAQRLEQEQKESKATAAPKSESPAAPYRGTREVFNSLRSGLYKFRSVLSDIEQLADSPAAQTFNVPFLLVCARAGQGKTHLLCDIAKNRIERDEPTVVLLGEKFTSGEPWSQILQMLDLKCTRDEWLGAMEAAAQARGGRALIFIDALNEGDGKKLWSKYLSGMLSDIEAFPRVGLVVSVRSSYESLVIPVSAKTRLHRIEHHGFSGHEYKATGAFFAHYGITRPSVPLLHPEWSDPLFLKLFCIGLQKAGMTSLPEGWSGITQIFNFFLDSVNTRLYVPEALDYDPALPLVRNAALQLTAKMVEHGKQWLPRTEAQAIVDALLPRSGYENSLFRRLVTEGVLTEERFPRFTEGQEETEWIDGIRIGFERFFDHLHARHLLDLGFDSTNPKAAFEASGIVGSLFQSKGSIYQYNGLLEALAVQVPERCTHELPYLMETLTDHRLMQQAFVQALLWRATSSINSETDRYINEYIIVGPYVGEFFDVSLTLAPRTDHPYNANNLHKYLMSFEMPDRDAWWSIYLHDSYEKQTALDRLLDWSQSNEDKAYLSNESARLCSIALCWCLTTPNRFVRDRATKGLVALLRSRLSVLPLLLDDFEGINDPYIRERLLAVCYGCCLQSPDANAVRELSQRIFFDIFVAPRERDEEVWPHILGRDYARGVVEIALHRHLIEGDEAEQMAKLSRPPYNSAWPSQWPDTSETDVLLDQSPSLRYSLNQGGDFGRYVVNSRLGDYNWSRHQLGKQPPPTLKERHDAFIESLGPKAREAFEKYQNAKKLREGFEFIESEKRLALFKSAMKLVLEAGEEMPSDEELSEVVEDDTLKAQEEETQIEFLAVLSDAERALFEIEARPHWKYPHLQDEPFDSHKLLPWIAQKVFDLGWTKERFGDFDSRVNYHRGDRTGHKPERMGKKYQWIAFHEIAARQADNFYLKDRENSQNKRSLRVYGGSWELSLRDIDPSFSLPSTKGDSDSGAWWANALYSNWYGIEGDVEWLSESEDLPPIEPLLYVTNPKDGSQWFSLDVSVIRHEPEAPGEERTDKVERGFWFMLKSYLVKKHDVNTFWKWAIQQDFMGRWMPESHEMRHVFWGEVFWSPAFESMNTPYYGRDQWTNERDKPEEDGSGFKTIPTPILFSVDGWAQEGGGYDCSLEQSAEFAIPCFQIWKEMGLRAGREGEWLNENGQLVAFDPSTREVGPSTLLIKREPFLEFLRTSNYDLVWTVLGEKQIVTWSAHFLGRLEISGAARLNEGGFEIKTTNQWIEPNSK